MRYLKYIRTYTYTYVIMYHTFVDQSTNSKKSSKKYVFVFCHVQHHIYIFVCTYVRIGCVHVRMYGRVYICIVMYIHM